ncbi:uncharacterized protein METZ01_LOCUS190171, partial [marine metagenome]
MKLLSLNFDHDGAGAFTGSPVMSKRLGALRQTIEIGFHIPLGRGVHESFPLVAFVMLEYPVHFTR